MRRVEGGMMCSSLVLEDRAGAAKVRCWLAVPQGLPALQAGAGARPKVEAAARKAQGGGAGAVCKPNAPSAAIASPSKLPARQSAAPSSRPSATPAPATAKPCPSAAR